MGRVQEFIQMESEGGLGKAGFTITTKDWIRRYDAIWQAGKEAFIRENRKKLRKSTGSYSGNTKVVLFAVEQYK